MFDLVYAEVLSPRDNDKKKIKEIMAKNKKSLAG